MASSSLESSDGHSPLVLLSYSPCSCSLFGNLLDALVGNPCSCSLIGNLLDALFGKGIITSMYCPMTEELRDFYTTISIVLLTRAYYLSDHSMNDLVEILELNRQGKLRAVVVFCNVDPMEAISPKGKFQMGLTNQMIDPVDLIRWKNALFEAYRLPHWGYVHPSDHKSKQKAEQTLARSVAEHVHKLSIIHSPPSSMGSSSQSQGRAGTSQVYLSLEATYRNSKLLSYCNWKMFPIFMNELPLVKFNVSNIEAIKDSQIAIILFSRYYAKSEPCREELKEIIECENRGTLKVRLMFEMADQQPPISEAQEILERGLQIDSKTVKRWMRVLPEQKVLPPLDYNSDYAEVARIIVKDVLAMLNETPSYADSEGWRFDVFLSFRGSDTRYTFTSHLYNALCQKGIRTFKDNPGLKAGQKRSDLFGEINQSRIAIIIFSEDYAGSKWCLDELKLIMDHKKSGRLTVIPIFYGVSPEEVRLKKKGKEKGCYQIAMEKMEKTYGMDNPKKVEDWKAALWQTGDLIGYCLPEGEDEGEVVLQVIERVIELLKNLPFTIVPHPFGIDDSLNNAKSLLRIGPPLVGVHMLGIWGTGGVGKTTLAKIIWNDILHKFDDGCFLSEVRATPLIELQRRLLSYLLRDEKLVVQDVDQGKTLIRQRLGGKRVLLVLDDVDKHDQLSALAGDISWFGKGSRIIITTRDNLLLKSLEVESTHEVQLLKEAEANILFLYHASGGKPESVINVGSSVVNQFLEYANGLPLALVVIGRLLRESCASECESILETIRQNPPSDIISVLKISFDRLDKNQQEMFLDIACFFNGWDKDNVMKILSCGLAVSYHTQILVGRCLVTYERDKVKMHDVLEEMGKAIAHGKASEDQDIHRTRIWLFEDLLKILPERMEKERQSIKGILLNSIPEKHKPINPSIFKDFTQLRMLIARNDALAVGGTLEFSSELRWLEWHKYVAPSIDLNFCQELGAIDLRRSEMTTILGENFTKLKYLNLYNCKSLKELPDLSNSSNLEELNLSGCKELSRLDNSIGKLKKLVYLNLEDCCNLSEVPTTLKSKNFRTINFFGCFKLRKFPEIKEKLMFIEEVNLGGTSVKELPDFFSNLVAVKILNLSLCKELSIIPSSIFKLQALEQLLAKGCPKLELFPRKVTGNSPGFPKLVVLDLEDCKLKEVELLRDLTCFKTLKEVNISGNVFTDVPECLTEFTSLDQLWLSNCKNLKILPEVPLNAKLYIMGCQNLECSPSLARVIHGTNRSFLLDLSNCPKLNLQDLEASLLPKVQVSEIRKLQVSLDVIVARANFPQWMNFQIWDSSSRRIEIRPHRISKDDILGLAISITFKVEPDCSPELSLEVGDYTKDIQSEFDIAHCNEAHTWFVYIPRSEDDTTKINWSNIITIEFKAGRTRIEKCGAQMICKNEIDEGRCMVDKIELEYEYEVELEEDRSDNESGEEEERSPTRL